MALHGRFRYRDLADLRRDIEERGIVIPLDEDTGILGDSVRVGSHELANRFAVHPMEGFDSDELGTPGDLSSRRYERYARGGSALIWFEATAVLREARSNPCQLWIHEGNVDAFADLVARTRRAAREEWGREPVLVLQLTHSGRYSKPDGVPAPLIAHHSPILDPCHGLPADYPLVTDAYLDRLQDVFVGAASLAARAGFDGVDVKGCHRYLVAELHASFTREGRYGGSFENRTRFLRETLGRIRSEVPGIFATTRLNAYDAIPHPYGFGVSPEDVTSPDLREPIQLIGELRDLGIPLLNLSVGNPYFNPHYGRPYDFPIEGVGVPDEHPLHGIARFLDITRRVQEAHSELPIVASGYSWLRQFMPYVASAVIRRGWATLIGQGRGAFAYPDSVREILSGRGMDPAKCCVTCSGCTQIMRDGTRTGCVVRDKDIYGPEYRLGRRFALDRLRAEASRCRQCVEPTCSCACPAGIDIPGFLKAFADGDIEASYRILRKRNALPEMCGVICPASEQCQGACVEQIFRESPIPIQDIQLMVSRLARRQGLAGVTFGPQTGKRVAVVGGGPAGLACAVSLLEKGHSVDLFEKGQRLGGTPDHAIPSERFATATAEIDAVLAPAREAGRLRIHFGEALGKAFSLSDLLARFDSVFLGFGLGNGPSLGSAEGVWQAGDFLRTVKSGALKRVPRSLAVLGGGNTAMDVALAALNAGVADVYVLYRRSFQEMPAWREERDDVLERGAHLLVLTQPTGYETCRDGNITGVRTVRTALGRADASGRRRPVPVDGSETVLPVAAAVEAMGQGVSDRIRDALPGIEWNERGLIGVTGRSMVTSLPRVFAGGDLVNGGTTAVQGIAEGMRAACGIDAMLCGVCEPQCSACGVL
jgi:NADPH-dependent glutamate synthase beta subunit-like oxidoreductase/2,4-dienoyl-CoA reductase-like NADH-dependent reductase (Old Yellow Enzyme family)